MVSMNAKRSTIYCGHCRPSVHCETLEDALEFTKREVWDWKLSLKKVNVLCDQHGRWCCGSTPDPNYQSINALNQILSFLSHPTSDLDSRFKSLQFIESIFIICNSETISFCETTTIILFATFGGYHGCGVRVKQKLCGMELPKHFWSTSQRFPLRLCSCCFSPRLCRGSIPVIWLCFEIFSQRCWCKKRFMQAHSFHIKSTQPSSNQLSPACGCKILHKWLRQRPHTKDKLKTTQNHHDLL